MQESCVLSIRPSQFRMEWSKFSVSDWSLVWNRWDGKRLLPLLSSSWHLTTELYLNFLLQMLSFSEFRSLFFRLSYRKRRNTILWVNDRLENMCPFWLIWRKPNCAYCNHECCHWCRRRLCTAILSRELKLETWNLAHLCTTVPTWCTSNI